MAMRAWRFQVRFMDRLQKTKTPRVIGQVVSCAMSAASR